MGYEDPTLMDENTVARRAIELAGRDPKSADFFRVLDFGIVTEKFEAAKRAVGEYAFDNNYVHRRFALEALAPFDQGAEKILQQLKQSEEEKRIAQVQKFANQHSVVRSCVGEH